MKTMLLAASLAVLSVSLADAQETGGIPIAGNPNAANVAKDTASAPNGQDAGAGAHQGRRHVGAKTPGHPHDGERQRHRDKPDRDP